MFSKPWSGVLPWLVGAVGTSMLIALEKSMYSCAMIWIVSVVMFWAVRSWVPTLCQNLSPKGKLWEASSVSDAPWVKDQWRPEHRTTSGIHDGPYSQPMIIQGTSPIASSDTPSQVGGAPARSHVNSHQSPAFLAQALKVFRGHIPPSLHHPFTTNPAGRLIRLTWSHRTEVAQD